MQHQFRGVGVAGVGHTPTGSPGFRLVGNKEFIRHLPGPCCSELFGTLVPTTEQIAALASEWEHERPGIWTRCVTSLTTVQMAAIASRMALERAGITAGSLGAIIFSTNTGERRFPKLSGELKKELGGDPQTTCQDISGSCADGGMMVVTGAALIASGLCDSVLCVASERTTRITDPVYWRGDNLFGDGSGAFVLVKDPCSSLFVCTNNDPSDNNLDLIRQDLTAGVYHPRWGREARVGPFRQASAEVQRWANREVKKAAVDFINSLGDLRELIQIVAPHQASGTTLELLETKLLRLLPFLKGKIPSNVRWRGNTSSASTPILISEAVSDGRLTSGGWFVGLPFGSGLEYAFYGGHYIG